MIDVDTDSGENLYAVLGVTENATDVEIKTAYRQLAKRFHPDSGRPGDAERFRRVREAYETLSDPERRRAYDGGGSSSAVFPVSWTSGFAEPLVPVGGFREVFARREPKIHLDIVLSHDEAERGARAVLEVPRDAPCHVCGGAGSDFLGCCAHCRGAGFLRDYERLVFTIPPAAEQGDYVAARTRDGQTVRARVSIRGGR